MTLSGDEIDPKETETGTEIPTEGFDPMSEPVVLGAAASVALSWLLFYGKGDKEQGCSSACGRRRFSVSQAT